MKGDDCQKPNGHERASPHEAESTLPLSPDPKQPSRIGPFQILELLGTGGMGDVYLAEQSEPIKRQVALKVIKVGLDTKEVIARFESERQALAMMNHPNVAKIYEAGTTDNGRPYFVMEYVPGEPITRYCDRHKLDLKSRLELFIPVCKAIHHAHQKGIIHRDIKPPNVLITTQDGKPMPKVIDFGVAKAIQQDLTQKTLFTEQGRMIGTPAYMSPEQAEMTGLNIDTTSDVYSLGVLLYEILVGALPFEERQLREAGIAEMHRIIRDVDPPKPSTKISSMGEQASINAQKRRLAPKALSKQIHGELDWITMRAMEKDRTRRYQSASEFASDVGRFLAGQPVLAHRPSTAYQLRKLVTRHKVRFALVMLLTTVLISASVILSIQAGRIARERDRANREAEVSEQVSKFLVDLFELTDPEEGMGNTITTREILDNGVIKIEKELLDQPLLRARLMETMGNAYKNLALFDPARTLLEDALKMKQNLLGEKNLDVAESKNNLGKFIMEVLYDPEGARPLLEESLKIREETLGPDHPDVAVTLNNLGILLAYVGDSEDAQQHFERALNIREKALGPDHPDVGRSLGNLAILQFRKDDHAGARLLLERALEIQEKALGPDHPLVAVCLTNLGVAHRGLGDRENSRLCNERALAIREKTLGPDHPMLKSNLNNLAVLLYDVGDYDAARPLFKRALAIVEKSFGPDHIQTQGAIYSLASVVALGGDRDGAITYLQQFLKCGGNNPAILEDTDLMSLHGDPEFEAIVAELLKKNQK